MPERIQRKRSKGWQMPPNTVAVTRGTMWGNPFIVAPEHTPGRNFNGRYFAVPTAQDAVACFREMLDSDGPTADAMRAALPTLRGKNLDSLCTPWNPCHAKGRL